MSTNSGNTPRYRVELKSIRGEIFADTIFCACIKAPFIKKANFWYIKTHVSSYWASQVYNSIGKQEKIQMTLIIQEIKYEGDKQSYQVISEVHRKPCVCIYIENANNNLKIDMTDMNAEVILVLVDHILYDMSTKHMFNRKLSNVTAFGALQQFENSLKTQYGDSTFYNNYVGITDSEKSDYIYEQILVAMINDLNVSDFLLFNKKMMNNISFYFHDDFFLDSNNKNHITNHLINLVDKSQFTPFDATKYFDTLTMTTITHETPYVDTFKKLTQGYDSVVVKTKYMFDDLTPESINSLFNPQVTNISQTEFDINEQRKYNNNSPEINFIKTGSRRQNSMQIYAPDDKAHALLRLHNARKFMNTVKNLSTIQSTDSFCDWIQFGRSYNLDITRPTEYLYTPILICNIFYKDGRNEATKHVGKSLMVEYYRDDIGLCSGCKYYLAPSFSCSLNSMFKDPDDNCYSHTPIGS